MLVEDRIEAIENQKKLERKGYESFFGGKQNETNFRKIKPKSKFDEHKSYLRTKEYHEEALTDIRRLWKQIYEDGRPVCKLMKAG